MTAGAYARLGANREAMQRGANAGLFSPPARRTLRSLWPGAHLVHRGQTAADQVRDWEIERLSDLSAAQIVLGVALTSAVIYLAFVAYYRRFLRPRKLRFSEENGGLSIGYAWIYPGLILARPTWLALFLLTFPFLMAFVFHEQITVPIVVATFLVCGIASYPFLQGVLNRTEVFISQDRVLTVRHGPLPGDHDKAQTIKDVANVYYHQEFVREYRRPMVAFPIMAYTIPGKLIQFMDHVDSEEDAKAIVQRIRQTLNFPQDVSLKLPPT